MPTNGSIFLGWGRDANSQGCGINPSCTFTVTQPAQLDFTATFSTPNGQDLLSVAINGPGLVTSDPVGISCPQTSCFALFDPGITVTLTAAPVNSSIFTGWGQGCSGTSTTCQVTISQNTPVTANFAAVNPTLSVTINNTGIGTGTITSDVTGINCPGSCSTTYPPGTVVTLTAAPGSGSTFTGWSGEANAFGCFTSLSCPITLGASSVQVIAGFNEPPPLPPPFDLTVSPSARLNLATGGSTATGVTLLSVDGFTDTVNLSCSVQPAAANAPTCLLNPSSVNLGANQAASSKLTINAFTTVSLKQAPIDLNRTLRALALAFPFPGFVVLGAVSRSTLARKRRRVSALLGLLVFLALFVVSCGGGGSSKSNGSTNNSAPGQYTITVVATGTTAQVQQTAVVTVTVQ